MSTPNVEERKGLFISHDTRDSGFAHSLADALKLRGLPVWIAEGNIEVGDSIVDSINDALLEAKFVVAVISVNSVSSRWVQREINVATMSQLAGDGLQVLPVRIDDTPIPPILKDVLYADFRDGFDGGVEKLVRAVSRQTEGQPEVSVGATAEAEIDLGELLENILTGMDRPDVALTWYRLFGDQIHNRFTTGTTEEWIIGLIDRAKKEKKTFRLVEILKQKYPHIQIP